MTAPVNRTAHSLQLQRMGPHSLETMRPSTLEAEEIPYIEGRAGF